MTQINWKEKINLKNDGILGFTVNQEKRADATSEGEGGGLPFLFLKIAQKHPDFAKKVP